MSRTSVTHRSSARAMQDPFYPDDLLPELQGMLAALADAEFRYENAREHLRRWTGPDAIRQRLLAQLDERCRQEREAYTCRLVDLRHRLLKVMAIQDICMAD